MGELIDKGKGKAKEVIGSATNNASLEAEGKADQVKGALKGKFEELKRSVKNALHHK